MVRDHVKQSLEYLIREYKVDGFRFDLTKGFMGTSTNVDGYNQERVNYLKEYAAHIRYVDANAVMICEHFVDSENYELSKEGIKVWRNMNHSYIKAMKRDMSQADFSGTVGGYNLVSYMESHDEERTNYEGQWSYNGSEIPFATRMERAKLNAAFFLLSPGPRMIWQFGEIGYDISINDNNDRVGKKPYKAPEYLKVAERKALYDTYAMLLKFRRDNPRFFDGDVNFNWAVGYGNQTERHIYSKSADGKHYALFGNFGTGTQTISVNLPSGVGTWYQYDNGAEWKGSSHSPSMAEGQFYLLVSDRSMCLK
jgi:1,4-alpha-glucan branching enzyme